MANPENDHSTKAKVKTTLLEVLSVLCSICLDEIAADNVDRSTAKLHCGHQFHLDCIGSAFNMKGAMQCPNCRKVEQGRWLYTRGPTRTIPEITMNDWTLHENRYGLSYPETPFNMQWCPFNGFVRVPLAFGALESLPPAYHNLHRHHNMLSGHGAASSVPHSYISYLRPIPSASSNTNETIEVPNFNYHWNGVLNPHTFPLTYMPHHHHNGVHANSTNQAQVAPVSLRSSRGDFGAMTGYGPYIHPFLYGHGSRSHERWHPSQTIHHPHRPTNPLGTPSTIISTTVGFHSRRAFPQQPISPYSVSNRNGGYFIIPSRGSLVLNSYETGNSWPVISADRDPNRTGNFWHMWS